MGNTIVKRTTLIVRDMEKSRAWYEEVLEMSAYYDDEVVLSGTGMAAGKKGDRTHLVILKCQDPVIGMIGLLQWIKPVWPAPKDIPSSVGYGMPTFVVDSDDVRALHERAVKLDSIIHSEPREWSVRGATGDMIDFLGMSLFDPDGHFFEVNQRLG